MEKVIGRPPIVVDEEEINEIIELYIKEKLYGARSKINYNGVKKFNEIIANNTKYVRKNGEFFRFYSRAVWAGKYQGKDYYGRQRIDEILSESQIEVIGQAFIPELADLNLLFDKIQSRAKLKLRVLRVFERERRKFHESELLMEKYKNERDEWRLKYQHLLQGVTNLMYQSQSIDNSLNDMFRLKGDSDALCTQEFCNMFDNDEHILNKLIYSNQNEELTEDNIIALNPKLQEEEFRGL